MKLLVTGSRNITAYHVLEAAISSFSLIFHNLLPITEIVSNRSCPVDFLAERWAANHKLPVRVMSLNPDIPAESLGYARNIDAGMIADAVLIIQDGDGTEFFNLEQVAKQLLRPVYTYQIPRTHPMG